MKYLVVFILFAAVTNKTEAKSWEWAEHENIFTNDQCKMVGRKRNYDITACKNECYKTPGCNAINVKLSMGRKDCQMRSCPVPIPEPSSDYGGLKWFSYFKTKSWEWAFRQKIFTNDQCKMVGRKRNYDITACKNECYKTPGCNAINVKLYMGRRDCQMRSCPVPIPEPSSDYGGFKWYSYFKTGN